MLFKTYSIARVSLIRNSVAYLNRRTNLKCFILEREHFIFLYEIISNDKL
jgi:hypothetical protein